MRLTIDRVYPDYSAPRWVGRIRVSAESHIYSSIRNLTEVGDTISESGICPCHVIAIGIPCLRNISRIIGRAKWFENSGEVGRNKISGIRNQLALGIDRVFSSIAATATRRIARGDIAIEGRTLAQPFRERLRWTIYVRNCKNNLFRRRNGVR